MSEPLFRTTRRIEFADTDMAGIVHFANFFRFMEAAEVAFLRSRGLSVALTWEGEKLGFPRISASCDYVSPARFEDLLDVVVSLKRLGTKSVTYGFEFYRGSDLIATGNVSSVCCRIGVEHQLEAIAIPASLRSKISPSQDLTASESHTELSGEEG
jgi:YbgC/YbaW family acyl-CoA thioester hydrolase